MDDSDSPESPAFYFKASIYGGGWDLGLFLLYFFSGGYY